MLLLTPVVVAPAASGRGTLDPAPNGESVGKLVFTRFSTANSNSDVWIMDAAGGDQTDISNNPPGVFDLEPSWSPSGRRVAFRRKIGRNSDIYVMNSDGSGVRQLTFGPARDAQPAWSPDGKLIAWESNVTGVDEIWLMNSDGSNPRQLTNDAGGDFMPTFSPDGGMIAFSGFTQSGNPQIFEINVDGSHEVQMTHDSSFDGDPAFSPSGRLIAFDSDRTGAAEIYVMRSDGSAPRQMTFDGQADIHPTWSPTGNQLAFASGRIDGAGNETIDIYRISLDGSGETPLTTSHDALEPDW